MTRPVRIGEHKARSDDVEGGIDVHWIGVFKRDDVDPVVRSKVPTHPLDAQEVCNLKVKTILKIFHSKFGKPKACRI